MEYKPFSNETGIAGPDYLSAWGRGGWSWGSIL